MRLTPGAIALSLALSASAGGWISDPVLLVAPEPGPGWQHSYPEFSDQSCTIAEECASLANGESVFSVVFRISDAGSVHDPTVEESCGRVEDPAPLFRAVRRWRFNPATQDGAPIETPAACVVLRHVDAGPQHDSGNEVHAPDPTTRSS